MLSLLLGAFSYSAFIFGVIFAQPAAALFAGVLAVEEVASFWVLFGLIVVTDLVMDCVWYVLGIKEGAAVLRFISRLFGVSDESVAKVQRVFHSHPAFILISAKLLGGFGMMPLILFTAGASRMPFRKYIALNAIGEIFWSGGLMLAGFFFSYSVERIDGVIGKFTVVAFALIVAVAFVYIIKNLRKRFL